MKKLVLPENKSVNDFRVMEEDAMEPGPDPGGVGAPPICFGAAAAAPPTGIFGGTDDDDDDLRRILLLLRFFLDIYGNIYEYEYEYYYYHRLFIARNATN